MQDTEKTTNVVILPKSDDAVFLDAVAGLARCLNAGQEARLSKDQLEHLLRLALRAVTR